jgi:hypothetical protein
MTVAELVHLAEGIADLKVRGNASLANGKLAVEDGRLIEARGYLEAAVHFYSDSAADNMLSLTLSELAYVLQQSGLFKEALTANQRALSLTVKSGDFVNTGPGLYDIARCQAALGNHKQAFDDCLHAALAFFLTGAVRHLSNGLSELGYILIDYDPGPTLGQGLPRGLIAAGLSDALIDAEESFSPPSGRALSPAECARVQRKLFGMAAFASCTSHGAELSGWANALMDIAQVSAKTSDQGRGIAQDRDLVSGLRNVVAVVDCISAFDQALTAAVSVPSLEMVESLVRKCYQLAEPTRRLIRLFEWLTMYLTRYTQIDGLTAVRFQEAADTCERTGEPFSLPKI